MASGCINDVATHIMEFSYAKMYDHFAGEK